VPLEQVLAKATQDVQGQLGTYDLYYLDQSWVATFAQECIDPVQYTKDKPDLAMPGFDWDDCSKPLVQGLAKYDGKMVGVSFDIPIFILMYRQDILEKHGIKVPTNYAEFTDAVHKITEAEKANNIFGTGLQAKSGHYSLECDWTQAVWGHGGSIFGKDKKFAGNDEQGVKGLGWYQELLSVAPPNSTASTWDGQFEMMHSGQVALVQGISTYGDRLVGIPYDIPIFILMYRKDLFDKHKLKVPTTMDEYMMAVKTLDEAERGNGIYGTTGQLKSGHYSLNCDWTAWLWANGGSVFGKDMFFSGNDADGMRGLGYMLDLVKHMPPAATTWTWDGEGQSVAQGNAAMLISW